MPDACTAVIVRKDLVDQTDLFRISVQPTLHDTVFWKFQLVYRHKTLVAPVVFTHRHESVALERGDEVLALVGNVIKVIQRRKSAVHQHKTKLQGVVNARPNHLAHQLVLGFLAAALDLPRLQIAVRAGLGHHLESHRYRVPLALIKRVQQVDPPD